MSDLLQKILIDNVNQPLLESLALQNQQQAQAFGITTENVKEKIETRLDLFHAVYHEVVEHCGVLQIYPVPIETLWNLWLPLALQLSSWRQAQNRGLIQGFLGGQGTGKTTLTTTLALILKQLGHQTAFLSIDDLYLPYHDRLELQKSDPRLIRRGPPGTHDTQLGLQVLNQFQQNQFPIDLPRFDKSAYNGAGDRTVSQRIDQADILLFEGWFVGVRPIDSVRFETAPSPIDTESDRAFARDMNDRLHDYLPLWERLDRLIVLYVPDYQLSKQWRKQAEHKMIAEGKTGMSDAEIDEFVDYFWKALHPELFIEPLARFAPRSSEGSSGWVDLTIEINADHQPEIIYKPT